MPAVGNRGLICEGGSPPRAPARAGGARRVPVSPRHGTSPPASAPQESRELGPWGYRSSPQPRGSFRGAGCTPKYPKPTTPDPAARSPQRLSVGRAPTGRPGAHSSPSAAAQLCEEGDAGRVTARVTAEDREMWSPAAVFTRRGKRQGGRGQRCLPALRLLGGRSERGEKPAATDLPAGPVRTSPAPPAPLPTHRSQPVSPRRGGGQTTSHCPHSASAFPARSFAEILRDPTSCLQLSSHHGSQGDVGWH